MLTQRTLKRTQRTTRARRVSILRSQHGGCGARGFENAKRGIRTTPKNVTELLDSTVRTIGLSSSAGGALMTYTNPTHSGTVSEMMDL